MTVRELEAAVRRMLEESQSSAPHNRVAPADVRTNVAEYLDELDELFARAPSTRNEPAWNLWVMDADEEAPASFLLAVVAPTEVELGVGHGDPAALRSVEGRRKRIPAQGAFDALTGFAATAPSRLRVPRMTFDAWVGYEDASGG